MTKHERIAQLVTIRHLVDGLIRAEAEQSETPTCCASPAPKNHSTFGSDEWRCENCGAVLVETQDGDAGESDNTK